MRLSRLVLAAFFGFGVCRIASAAVNPFEVIGETWSAWKDRLFGSGNATPAVVDAPARGPVPIQPGHPVRIAIGNDAPERDFARGSSRYRIVELPAPLAHAAVRVQVSALPNEHGRGHVVFKPFLYVLGDDDAPRDPVEVKPLHLDIRPFRRTRLLGCVMLSDVRRFAVATSKAAIGKNYESEVREAVKAPTQGGFYYATDAVKVRLPYAATGSVVIEVSAQKEAGHGC